MILDAILNFVGKWWNTFFLTFVIAAMLLGWLNLITGYAVIILLLLCGIIRGLRNVVMKLGEIRDLLDTEPVKREGPWT